MTMKITCKKSLCFWFCRCGFYIKNKSVEVIKRYQILGDEIKRPSKNDQLIFLLGIKRFKPALWVINMIYFAFILYFTCLREKRHMILSVKVQLPVETVLRYSTIESNLVLWCKLFTKQFNPKLQERKDTCSESLVTTKPPTHLQIANSRSHFG